MIWGVKEKGAEVVLRNGALGGSRPGHGRSSEKRRKKAKHCGPAALGSWRRGRSPNGRFTVGRILEVAANPGALQGKPCFGAEEEFWVLVIEGQAVSGTCCSWRRRDS